LRWFAVVCGGLRLLAVVGGGFYDLPMVWGVRGAVVNGSDFLTADGWLF
jgi:hypothetical protein